MARELKRWLLVVLALVSTWGSQAWAAGVPEWRFRQPRGAPPVALSSAVLTADDRAYLASLPEIRVALQRVGAPPFERVDESGEISGIQPEMLVMLARTYGLRLRPVVLPDWPAVLAAVREGRADMVLTLAVTADRLQYLSYTLGTVSVPVAVFARNGAPAVPLDGARFALEREYFSNDQVARLFPRASVVNTDTTVQALQRVAQGDADAYLGSLFEALDLLSANPVPGVQVQQILANGSGYYHFGLRKDWARLAGLLNKGITSWRTGPEQAAVAAALAASSLPGGLKIPAPLALSARDTDALAERSVWRMGAVRGLALLNDVDGQGQHTGIAADYAEQVARRLGVGLQLVPFDNVADMLDALRQNRIDVVPFLTRTEERARQFGLSDPYLEMPYLLVARSDAPLYWGLASLAGKRLALAAQHPLREVVAQKYPQIQVLDPRDGNEALDMVALGDADAAVEVKLFANLRINADNGGRLRALGPVDEVSAQFRFATSAQALPLLPLINRALADIPAPEQDRLLRRWVAVDLQPPIPWRRWAPTIAVGSSALLLLAAGTAWWARRLAREVKRRRRADEQLDDIGRTLPGVAFRYVLDEQHNILRTFFTSGAEAFFGVAPPPRQTVVAFLGPLLDPKYHAEAEKAQQESMLSGKTFRFTWPFTRPGATECWFYAEAVRSTTREGFTAWTGYVIDVTVQHELQERVARESRERHLMLASASHELRAPAHTLALALQDELLVQVPAEAQRPLQIARDAARNIGELLDDVLDAARLDAGRLELRPQEFDLHALLRQLAAAFQPVMADQGLAFQVTLAEGLPQTVHGDPLRLKQVLTNLLSNAAKYTPSGSVTLEAKPGALPTGLPALHLVVQDTGVGIAPDQQQRLFEPFVTAHAPRPGGGSSSGLGLSICRRLMALMGGDITLTSQPGVGTRVEVCLPLAPLVPRALRRNGVLLLCDDDQVSRTLLAAALARLGYAVVEASGGEEALARWQQGDVRLLITDLHMPGLDGAGLVRQIRSAEQARAATEHTAVVVCSGTPVPTQAPGSDAPPYDAYVRKPVDLRTLGDTLRALMPAGH